MAGTAKPLSAKEQAYLDRVKTETMKPLDPSTSKVGASQRDAISKLQSMFGSFGTEYMLPFVDKYGPFKGENYVGGLTPEDYEREAAIGKQEAPIESSVANAIPKAAAIAAAAPIAGPALGGQALAGLTGGAGWEFLTNTLPDLISGTRKEEPVGETVADVATSGLSEAAGVPISMLAQKIAMPFTYLARNYGPSLSPEILEGAQKLIARARENGIIMPMVDAVRRVTSEIGAPGKEVRVAAELGDKVARDIKKVGTGAVTSTEDVARRNVDELTASGRETAQEVSDILGSGPGRREAGTGVGQVQMNRGNQLIEGVRSAVSQRMPGVRSNSPEMYEETLKELNKQILTTRDPTDKMLLQHAAEDTKEMLTAQAKTRSKAIPGIEKQEELTRLGETVAEGAENLNTPGMRQELDRERRAADLRRATGSGNFSDLVGKVSRNLPTLAGLTGASGLGYGSGNSALGLGLAAGTLGIRGAQELGERSVQRATPSFLDATLTQGDQVLGLLGKGGPETAVAAPVGWAQGEGAKGLLGMFPMLSEIPGVGPTLDYLMPTPAMQEEKIKRRQKARKGEPL